MIFMSVHECDANVFNMDGKRSAQLTLQTAHVFPFSPDQIYLFRELRKISFLRILIFYPLDFRYCDAIISRLYKTPSTRPPERRRTKWPTP